MGTFSGAERRRYVRVSAELSIRLHYKELLISYPAAFARDISTGGLGVVIVGVYPDSYREIMEGNESIEVEIDLPQSEALRIPAVAVWGCVERGDGGEPGVFRIGLKFTEVPDREKDLLAEFVRRKVGEKLLEEKSGEARRRRG